MKSQCFIFMIIVLFSLPIYGQQLDFNEVVTPPQTQANTIEAYLVQLAWINRPNVRALQSEHKQAELDIKGNKLNWTQALGFNFGFNRSTALSNPDTGENVFFPRVSIGASLNLNPLITTPIDVKIAKENLKITEAVLDQEKLLIRRQVLELYQQYLLAKEVLKVRTNMEEDANATHQLMVQLFRNKEVNFEDYNQSYTTYHAAVEGRLEAKTDVQLKKIALEEWIGIPLEEAEANYN